MTAVAMAMPLVTALVVLPTASRSARIWRAFLSMPVISPMPLALSAMGPKASMLMLLPVRVSCPMPHRATPYRIMVKLSPWKMRTEARMAPAMTKTAHTELSMPT